MLEMHLWMNIYMQSFWLFLIRILKLERFKCRSLTAGEIKLCQSVFADRINYRQVKVMNHPYLPWQSMHVFMAPSGYIHARSLNYCNDYSQQSLGYQAVFIHEMAHVYQYQQRINVLLKGALLQSAYFLSFKKYDPYVYQLKANKDFFDYNIEQQGDIAKDIFLGKINNIILNAPPSNKASMQS